MTPFYLLQLAEKVGIVNKRIIFKKCKHFFFKSCVSFRLEEAPATYNFKGERRDKFDVLNMGTKDKVTLSYLIVSLF